MPALPTSLEILDRLRSKIGQAEHYPDGMASDYRVAQLLGITKAAVSQIRLGHATWGQPTALKIAPLLDLDPAYLLTCLQAERTVNLTVRKIWEKVAGSLAILLMAFAIFVSDVPRASAEGTRHVYTLCARWLRRWAWIGMSFALTYTLAGCASMPGSDYHHQVEARAVELQARFNAVAGTLYPVPGILWRDGGCALGDDVGDAISKVTITNLHTHAVQTYPVDVLVLTDCRDPAGAAEQLANTLPHELAHLDANRYYGDDEDHGPLWQRIAVLLGVPRTDSYITDPTVRAGGS